MSFVAFTAHMPSGGALTAYTTDAGDQVYMMQAIANDQDAANDPQLQAAVQSFRLLGAPAPASSETFTFHTHVADIHSSHTVLTTLIARVVVVVLIRLMLKGRK